MVAHHPGHGVRRCPPPSGSVGLLFPGGCLCVWFLFLHFEYRHGLIFSFFLLFRLVFHWFAYGVAGLFPGFVYGVALVFIAWSMGLLDWFYCTSVH